MRGLMGLLSAGLLLAVTSPAFRDPPRDDFPLSSYPMFTSRRGDVASVRTVLGVTRQGRHETLDPLRIAGDSWVILAAATVDEAVRAGPDAARALCDAVARRVAADPARRGRLASLEVVTEVYDTRRFFAGDEAPRERRVHASCPVPPG